MLKNDDETHSEGDSVSDIELSSANDTRSTLPTKIDPASSLSRSTQYLPPEIPRRSLKRRAGENECAEKIKKRYGLDMSAEEDENWDEICDQETLALSVGTTYAASGLKQTLHGNIYQLKLLMLFVKRGLQEGYAFRLATEMIAAEKFDDVVFHYGDETTGRPICRYLQAKHSQDGSRKISPNNLLNETDDNFSLKKYFVSYRKIMKRVKGHPELIGSDFKDCIICTNIDFDFTKKKDEQPKFRVIVEEDKEHGLCPEDLEASEIGLEKIGGIDAILDCKNMLKQSARYKVVINDRHNLHEILRESSDAYLLAKILSKHVFNKTKMTLRTGIFKIYHVALANHVINVNKKRFYSRFRIDITTLSPAVKKFREIFGAELLSLMRSQDETATEEMMRKKMENNELEFSEHFGQECKESKESKLTNLKEFSAAFVRLIRKAEADNIVVIDKKVCNRNAEKESDEEVIGSDIDKLAIRALVVQDNIIKFNSKFFEDGVLSGLPDSMTDFRAELKNILGVEYEDLRKYRFVVKNSPHHWDLLYATDQLPDDKVERREIREFFEKLVFAVNQPNEVELGEIIRKEIGEDSRFNDLSANLVSNSFQTKMLDWFKKKDEKQGKEGEFLTSEDGEAFFKSMENQIGNLICSGLSSSYPEVLERYGVEFDVENQELNDFLDNKDKRVLNLITTGDTLPAAIRTYKTIRGSTKYKEDCSLIFMQLCTLLPKKTDRLVTTSFTSPGRYDLLVIDCGSPNIQDLQNLYTVYNKLCDIIVVENSPKKLILITQTIEVSSGVHSDVNCKTFETKLYEVVHFKDLKKESRTKLLTQPIINLQSLPKTDCTSFLNLLGDCFISEHLTDFGDAINASTLVSLIRGDEIKVGNDLKTLGETEDFYIHRRFNPQVIIKADIYKSQKKSDVFAISGTDLKELLELVKDMEKIRLFDQIDREIPQSCKFIILDKERDKEEFEKLCAECLDKNIHWLKRKSQKLIWQDSRGSISNLIEHRDVDSCNVDESTTSYLEENQIADLDKGCKVIIISDTAGMGKSTVLTSLAERIKQRNKNLWVIKIDLNKFTDELKREENLRFDGVDVHRAVEFLVEILTELRIGLEKKVLKIMIQHCGGVVLLVDGFDEISPNYKKTVMAVLRGLKKSIGVEKLFISTRPQFREVLERGLGTFSHTIEPFSEINQVRFLEMFWTKTLKLDRDVQKTSERLTTYAETLVREINRALGIKVPSTIGNQADTFFGIPLQTRMIAEIYQKNKEGKVRDFDTCEEFLRSTTAKPRLPLKMNIVDLYKYFVHSKHEILYDEKNKMIRTIPGIIEMTKENHATSLEKHQRFALYTLFDSKVLEILLDRTERKSLEIHRNQIKDGNEKTGIINNEAQFIHRSFAEYFTAVFLINKLMEGDYDEMAQEFIVERLLLQPEYHIIRTFLNGLLPASSALYDRESEKYVSADGSWRIVSEKGLSQWRRTIFHIAVQERHDEIIKFFLKNFGEKNEISKFLNEAEDRFHRTAICVAATSQHWDQLKLLVTIGGADVNSPDHYSHETPLHWAAFSGSQMMVEWLVENGADFHAQSIENHTPLHSAARAGKLEVLEWLINKTRVPVNSLLHDTRISEAPLTVFQWLVEEKDASHEARDDTGESLIYKAVSWGRADVVEWLVTDKGVTLEHEADGGTNLIHLAIKGNHWDIVKCLVKSRAFSLVVEDIIGSAVLECAIGRALLHDIKWLVYHKGIDVNAKMTNGDTLVHSSVAHGRLDVVQWLVTKKAVDLTIPDGNGKMILHKAAVSGDLDIIQFLIRTDKVDVSDMDNDNRTALDVYHAHHAQNRNTAIEKLLHQSTE